MTSTNGDVRLVIQEYDFDAMGDDWETLVTTAKEIVNAHDRNRWALGDIGRKAELRHGEGAVKSLANAVGVRPSVYYDYWHVADFFQGDDIRHGFAATVTWSHFREAARLDDKVVDEFETAMSLLEQAEAKHWTVDTLRDEVNRLIGKPPNRKKAFSADAEIVSVEHAEHGMVHVTFEVAQDVDIRRLRAMQKEIVTLKVFADPETVKRLNALQKQQEAENAAAGA